MAILCTSIACHELPPEKNRASLLLHDLKTTVQEKKILYGHQDTYLYGHNGWRMTENDTCFHSDIQEVCGKFPAIFGSDLGLIGYNQEKNIDRNSFSDIRRAAVHHVKEGGIVTFSWHPRNPVTNGDSWDVNNGHDTVSEILEGGAKHGYFMEWLENMADFFETLADEEGEKIPFIFRPWHEHTGSWFWWGKEHCTKDEYIDLWKMTWKYMVLERGFDNIVWAYSPNSGCTETEYMERYPGDDYVDILGLDCYEYQDNGIDNPAERLMEANANFRTELDRHLKFMTDLGKRHGKLIAITECGFESLPYVDWWTEVLYETIKDYPVAYVMSWRNDDRMEGHYFGPWKGNHTEADFIRFSNSEKMKFLNK